MIDFEKIRAEEPVTVLAETTDPLAGEPYAIVLSVEERDALLEVVDVAEALYQAWFADGVATIAPFAPWLGQVLHKLEPFEED